MKQTPPAVPKLQLKLLDQRTSGQGKGCVPHDGLATVSLPKCHQRKPRPLKGPQRFHVPVPGRTERSKPFARPSRPHQMQTSAKMPALIELVLPSLTPAPWWTSKFLPSKHVLSKKETRPIAGCASPRSGLAPLASTLYLAPTTFTELVTSM